MIFLKVLNTKKVATGKCVCVYHILDVYIMYIYKYIYIIYIYI